MFIDQKAEKDAKIKEIQIMRNELEGQVPEVKELRMKYENLKQVHSKEYNHRKDKEAKLDQANADLQKHK